MSVSGAAPVRRSRARVVVVGGGPAGIMSGFLLARAGIEVIVLERHEDFLIDFRGDTIHASTLTLMDELGLIDEFLALPHHKTSGATIALLDKVYRTADFSHLPARFKFVAMMPQWEFLNFLSTKAQALYPAFHLMMQAEATELIEAGGEIAGVKVKTPEGLVEIAADLVIAADGRHSKMRHDAGLVPREFPWPADVLWMRLPRKSGDPDEVTVKLASGAWMVTANRGDYWAAAYCIPKGTYAAVRAEGLAKFQDRLRKLGGMAADRADTIRSLDEVSLLKVAVNRLQKWAKPGLLCIGDAAHAMSPIGGVGVGLAIQDAVAAVNILWRPLAEGKGRPSLELLEKVQRRREFPARATQRMQLGMQKSLYTQCLQGKEIKVPFMPRLLNVIPLLQRLTGYTAAIGLRPEHIRCPQRTLEEAA